MEKFNQFLKRYLFWEGVVFGVLACVWVYGTFIKEGYEQVRIKKDLLEQDYAKKAIFEEKYYQEQLQTHNLGIKISDLQLQLQDSERKYGDLRDGRWEEKYNSERLARISSEEQLASAQGRLTGMISVRDQTVKDDESLKAKLQATERERDALKSLYQGGTKKVVKPLTSVQDTTQAKSASASADNVLAAMNGMNVFDVGGFIVSSAPKIKDGIPPELFIAMLAQASDFDRADVVAATAKYVQRPISSKQMSIIGGMLNPFDSSEAMKAFVQP